MDHAIQDHKTCGLNYDLIYDDLINYDMNYDDWINYDMNDDDMNDDDMMNWSKII